jgi:putative transposase
MQTLRKALDRRGRPDRVVVDGSRTNQEAIVSREMAHRSPTKAPLPSRPVKIGKSKYLNNPTKLDHGRIKRRVRPMPGFKSLVTAATILSGVELIRMVHKRQARFAFDRSQSLKEQVAILTA